MPNIHHLSRWLLLAGVLSSCILTHTSMGQAYCALRDPVRVLYEVYPEADGHRSIIRTVTVEDRAAIARVLPFTIHFDELGRHTLYVTVQEGRPLGILHARSERGRYGLTEIAWSLTLDGKITDVAFQRCRDPKLRAALTDQLRAKLIGADVPTLLRLLEEDGLSEEVRILIQSAAKTAAVTFIVWEEDLLPIRAEAKAASAWPDLDPVLTVRALNQSTVTPNSGLIANSIYAWNATGADGTDLGTLVRSLWKLDGHQAEIWCQCDSAGCIIDVQTLDGDDPSISNAFKEVIGLNGLNISECATAAGVAAGEVLRAIDTP
jgi:hypothetical protein